MPGYVIAEVNITNPETFARYGAGIPGTIEAFGGRYLVRGGNPAGAEGDWQPARIVVIEFPSLEQARRWYESAEYAPLKELRQQSADTRLIFVEGY